MTDISELENPQPLALTSSEFSLANAFDLPCFVETPYTRCAMDLCSALQQSRTLGLLVGVPGSGKTWAVQSAAQKQHQPPLIAASPVLYTSVDVENSPRPLLTNILNCLGPDYRAPVPDMINLACCWIHRREVALIILDEAERLEKASLDVIQDIHERTRCAFLFVGDVDLIVRFRKHPAISNRIGATLEMTQLNFDEMVHFLESWLDVRAQSKRYSRNYAELYPIRYSEPEDLTLLKEMYRATFGNLRRIMILVQEAERIADINGQRFVLLETVQAAARLLSGASR